MSEQGEEVTMEKANHPQADGPLAGSLTPAQQAHEARHGTTPTLNDAFPTGPTRSPQSDPTTGITATRRVTNIELGDAVKNSMTQQGMIIREEFSMHLDQLIAQGSSGFRMLDS